MRKIKPLFTLLTVLIAGSLGFISCNDDGGEKEPPVKPLTVSPENISFEKSVSARYITVTTTGSSWDATVTSENSSWLSIAKEEGRILVTTNTANFDVKSRAAVITVTSDSSNEPAKIEITQFGSKGEIIVNPKSLVFDASGNTPKDVVITTNIPSAEWSVAVEETAKNWLTITKGTDKITVNVTDKSEIGSRQGKVIFTSEHMEQTVEFTVSQKGLSQIITYDSAEGYYFGNIDGTGTGNFVIDLCMADDYMNGIIIDGYSILANDASSFVISSGQYSVSKTSGAVNTLIEGSTSENMMSLLGTFTYNYDAFKYIFGREGMTVDVVHTASNYEISANVYGEDLDGNIMQDIIIKYSGPITFSDDRTPFEQMTNGNYVFDATPHYSGGPSTWTTAMEKKSTYLEFKGFAQYSSTKLWADYIHEEDGNIVRHFRPDTKTNYGGQGSGVVASSMRYCFITSTDDLYVLNKGGSIPATWDNTTKILTFGDAAYTYEGSNYDLMLGLFGFDANGDAVARYSDLYKGMTATLQSARSSSGSANRYAYPKLDKFNLAPASSVKSERKADTSVKLTPVDGNRYKSIKTIEFDASKVKTRK